MQVEIVNWDKYNPRHDAKKWSWWRFQNDLFDDEDLEDLTKTDIIVFAFLCCRRNKAAKPVFDVKAEKSCKRARCTLNEFIDSANNLENLGLVKIHVRERTRTNVDVRERTDPYPTDGRTDVVTKRARTSTDVPPINPTSKAVALAPLFAPTPSPDALEEPRGADVWRAYRAAYMARYGVEPVRDAKVNANCKQLVKILGGDGAVGVVRFYLTHDKSYYVGRTHDLGACVADARGLHTQMLAGHRVSSTEAQQADKRSEQAQVFARVAARFAAKEEEAKGGQ
jgi:hypothetical protein